MNITEIPLERVIIDNIPGAAKEGAALVGVSIDDTPIDIVKSINTYLAKPPKRMWFKRIDNWTDRAMPLGALWGLQMIREFDWEWVHLLHHEHNAARLVGVFDRRRSIGIYPFHFVYGCVHNRVYPTVELAFNMLKTGAIPSFAEGALENLMDGVQHIVPPA